MGLALLPGESFEDLFALAGNKKIDSLLVLENDLYRRAAEKSVDELFKKSSQIIVLDHLLNKTAQKADILLPATTFAESEGTIINNEGRAQRYYKAIDNANQVKESWQWIRALIKIRDVNNSSLWNRFDDIIESLTRELPYFSKLKNYVPGADFRMLNAKIPRQTIRYSGRTAMNANIAVSEPKLLQDPDSPLAFSMEGIQEKPPSSLVPFYWTPGWNSVQALYINYLDEPDTSLKGGDPGIRLIEPVTKDDTNYFEWKNHNAEAEKDEFQIVPVYQIFGSDELSSFSPSVMQKIQEPFVLINEEDAEKIHVADSDFIQVEISEIKIRVKVKTVDTPVQGLAGLSVNLTLMPFVKLPGRGKFHKL
jgi:NADH-quinone oxidoreductase subunit G